MMPMVLGQPGISNPPPAADLPSFGENRGPGCAPLVSSR
jgi:hypothetical protein